VRIEDTDRNRFVPESEKAIFEALNWYGITHDEGPDIGGAFGPYRQSERLAIYKPYIEELKEKGTLYPCFCTAERLQEMREGQQRDKKPTGYDRYCRSLPLAEAKKKMNTEPYVLRLKMPTEGESTFADKIRGEISFSNALIDDQVLVKSDGWPTYHLAVVIDDHLMEITTVIRGEEWISSTPKHLALYKAFDWQPPVFAHVPLILGTDRSKLSKRHGDLSALSFRDRGFLPEAMINFLALLGWHPKGEKEMLTRQQISEEFRLEDVHAAGAIFNEEKLRWMNGQYIKALPPQRFIQLALPFVLQSMVAKGNREMVLPVSGKKISNGLLEKSLLAVQNRLQQLDETGAAITTYLEPKDDYAGELLIAKKSTAVNTIETLKMLEEYMQTIAESDYTEEMLEKILRQFITDKKLGVGETLWPLRVALSGEAVSPSPFSLASVVGKQETINRITLASQKLSSQHE